MCHTVTHPEICLACRELGGASRALKILARPVLIRERFADATVPESDAGAAQDRIVVKDRIADAMFQQLLLHTGGDADEALRWLTQLDSRYGLTDDEMGIGDFIEELKNRGLIDRDEQTGLLAITARTERGLRERALEEIFSKLRRGARGDHATPYAGDAHYADWPQTLQKLRELKPAALIPGRGDALTTPESVEEGLAGTQAFIAALYASVQASVTAGHSLKQAYDAAYATLAPRYGNWVIFDHCMPFDVTRAYDEATQYRDPRIWTAERDIEMWKSLEG